MALDKDGDACQVQGSGKKPYVLKNVGGVLSCSCPAWCNQSLAINREKSMIDKNEAIKEIIRRGGEIEIEGKFGTKALRVSDECDELLVLAASGWRQYSSRFGARRARIAYLCGRDDNGPWAVRIPGTIERVSDALAWVEPRAVHEARAGGRPPRRQGDVYVVPDWPDKAAKTARELPARHRWDPETRTLYHDDPKRPHAPIHAPFPCRFVAQRVYQMGRTTRRGRGD